MKTDFTELPIDVIQYIVGLRKEAQDMRRQRNGARAEADTLRALVADLRAALGSGHSA